MELTTETPVEIGRGSRRVCMRIPGTDLCLKRYRDDDEVGASVRREIASSRFDRRRNTCAQEYDYFQSLKARLSPETLSVFPERLELRHDDKFGWHLVESLVLNGDGSVPEKFSRVYRRASAAQQIRLYAEFCSLMRTFEEAAVRFYDPQNVIVQWPGKPFEGSEFRLRIVDFEPVSRTFLPLDLLASAFCRMKLRRRVRRYASEHLRRVYNPLPWRERAAWDAIVAAEGAKMGLSSCRALFENDSANDILYEGLYKGRPCMIKCSSRAPESIANEYELASRLHEAAPLHFPAAYACHPGPMAFVALEKIEGGRTIAAADCADYEDDIAAISDALFKANVVHRSMLPSSFLVGADGHLRLVDFQFAVDMATRRVDPWLASRPVHHFCASAAVRGKGRAWWDDAAFLARRVPALRHVLSPRIGRLRLEMRLPLRARLRIWLAALDVRIRRLFAKRGSWRRSVLDLRLEKLK